MRTIIYYKLVFALLFVPLLACAGNEMNGRHTKQKKISKSFPVSANALLEVDNSYGNIDITTWNENRIEMEVIIKASGDDEEAVIERLRKLGVDFSNSKSRVTAITRFEEENSSWWSGLFGNSNKVNIEINYRIKAPVTNSVKLENDYGNISIDRLEGNADIDCDYGRLLIGRLLGTTNSLSFDYTRNSKIDYIKRGEINADYSEFSIEEAGTLELSADYTDTHIRKVENITFNGDYGNLRLDKVKNVSGRGDYLGTEIGLVYGSLTLNLDYGSASIERIMKSAQKVDISSDYTGIKIGYENGSPFRFSVRTSYGSVRGIDGADFQINKRHQESTEDYYEGYYKENSGGSVSIDSSYGNITFTN